MPLPGWGRDRHLRRLEASFAGVPPTGARLEKAARDYGRALLDALPQDPALAGRLFRDYDARLPDEVYRSAFPPGHPESLAAIASASAPDVDALTVTFEVATRLRLSSVQRQARDGLAGLTTSDADRLVSRLDRWHELGLLDRDVLTRSVRAHLTAAPLGRNAHVWTAFLTALPETVVPDLFEVQALLGRGARALTLADSEARRQEALRCCAGSPRIDDVRAGIAVARREGDEILTALEAQAAELFFARGEFADALPHAEAAGRGDLASECHERLGHPDEALESCPPDLPERLVRLAEQCWRQIDVLVERREFTEAGRHAHAVVTRLQDATDPGEELVRHRAESAARCEAVATTGRRHFEALVRAAGAPDVASPGNAAGPADAATVRQEWSRFEEAVGAPLRAAEQAEQAGDLYRAHGLYLRADRRGDAERVLRNEPDAWRARAQARQDGGDLAGAAELYAEGGALEEAVALFLEADRPAEAARRLIEWRGDEAIEDPRLAGCLRECGNVEKLAELCLRAVDRRGRDTKAFEVLRELTDDSLLPPHLEPEVSELLERLGAQGRDVFERHAAGWVARARKDIDDRYARIWALDLGTTTCAVAVYDSRTGQPILCPWKGRPYFPSTLSVDETGNEQVGVDGEEALAGWVKGHISGAKRQIGKAFGFRVRSRVYRPEEVAAKLIRHARDLVEGFLAEQVLERVCELARGELDEVRTEWLSWLRGEHDLRPDRPRAIVTIPAFFRNNQKQATRSACTIAGVEAVRLIHEPTAACIAATRQRRLQGQVTVVDLGAGTLDISAIDTGDGVFEVEQVLGDNHFGGKDFDAVIAKALEDRLAREGIEVPAKGRARMRFQLAAEYLKIGLSAQQHATYPMPGFNDDPGFRLELDRDELVGILAEPLDRLRAVCERLKDALSAKPDHLVLVGGPMLAPYVTELVEEVFGLRRTVLSDPRTAVSTGAALQAAALCGALKEQLLLDVTPLALGIKIHPTSGQPEFSTLIEANTTIPIVRCGDYSTTVDNQDTVAIEIYNGNLRPESRIGQFLLEDIPPAPKGKPEIEVTFSIDASCVLNVTALDKQTGNRRSVKVNDTTLLSPDEIREMTERHVAHVEWEARQQELRELRGELADLVEEARRADGGPLFTEFRRRLRDHRTTTARLDSRTEGVLAEIYGPASTELETELLSMRAPLLDLATKAAEYLDDQQGDLNEGRHLLTGLRDRLGRLRAGLAQVTLWNSVLGRLADAEADPLRRFRSHHAGGAYDRALEALAELPGPPADPEDLRRWLHCLAETGAAADYRRTLIEHAEPLGAVVLDPARLEEFLRRARSAIVHVSRGASGFLISDRLVVTSRSGLDGRTAADLVVETDDGPREVRHVFTPDSAHLKVVALLLGEPVATPPLRLGHAGLVRIGDLVYAADPSRRFLLPGVVDSFERFPEQNLRLYRTALRMPPESDGGPLLNELGEVVGVVTGRSMSGDVTFAVTIDDLAGLLAGAGFGVIGP